MALYSDLYWEPSGVVAANATVRVFPRFSSTLAPLFADPAMVVPIANPTATNGVGILQFYTAPGDYWIHIRGLTFDVVIGDDSSWHATYEHTQSVAAATWVITHNLNAEPDTTIIVGGSVVSYAQVTYTDLNTVTVTFAAPQTGTAYLRR